MYRNLSQKSKIQIEVLLFFLIQTISIFLPFREYYDEDGSIVKIEYGYESGTTLFLCLYLVTSALCLLTFSRIAVRISTIVISILLFYNFFLNNIIFNLFVPYGPISPETRIGYWICFFCVLLMIVRAEIWRKKFEVINEEFE